MTTKTKTLYGKLVYNDKLSRKEDAEYELHTPGIFHNISNLLKQVYYADNNRINIKIFNSTPDGLKLIYNEDGNLLLKKNAYCIYGYHINGEDLDTALFNNVDNFIEVIVLAEGIERNQNETRKLIS